VLNCIEERAEALSGSGHGNSFHIHLIGDTGQMPHWFGAPGTRRNPHCAFVLWRCRALPGWTAGAAVPTWFVSGITLFSCYTVFVSSKSQLRNVTVTLEEDVAQWARIEAARRDTSVSRLLGELLKERMTAQDGYERAMRRALGRKPFLRSTGRYLTREEAHDRSRLR
jgi:hypothetical protein